MNRGTPTFKSPSVGIARDFGKRTPEIVPEGIINGQCFKAENTVTGTTRILEVEDK